MMNDYESKLFESFPAPERHPSVFSAVARLFDIKTAKPDACSVLELGCGTGGNLLPLAAQYGGSSYIGIDSSERHIDEANKRKFAAGLENIDFILSDLREFKTDRTFDFVLCHGLYSWVAPDVQEHIFERIRESLAPNGIALVSVNVSPGWNARNSVREALRLQDDARRAVEERIADARALLARLQEIQIDDYSPYGMQFRTELENILSQSDGFLLHEMLTEDHSAPTVMQFLSHATAHGLRYCGDGRFNRIRFHRVPAPGRLARISNEYEQIVAREQCVDLLFPKAFRSFLLCSEDTSVDYDIAVNRVESLYLTSPLVAVSESCSVETDQSIEFRSPYDHTISERVPVRKAALVHLSEIWPQSQRVDRLISSAAEKAGMTLNASERAGFLLWILDLFAQGLVELRCDTPGCVNTIPEKPKVPAAFRSFAKDAYWLATLRHEYVPLNEFSKRVVLLLDGEHDFQEIVTALLAAIETGDFGMREDGAEVSDAKRKKELVEEHLHETLALFCSAGLLC